MSAAQPSLTLVRPRRTGASAPSTETHSIPTTAPAPTPAAPVRSGDTPQSGHPAQTGHTTRSGHPVQSGRTTQSSGAASAEAATATSQPLDPQDRQLLESMSPALATALVEVLVGSRAATSIEKWVGAGNVAASGAARRLSPRRLEPQSLREVAIGMLEDSDLSARARDVAYGFRAAGGPERAAQLCEEVAASG